MTKMLPQLEKNPALDPSQDFYGLRREGIGHIQSAGSDQWTDYNVHDPGITILEALCYAITDLGYRIGWHINDILAPKTPSADPTQPYPGQAFFTARHILTVNPTTENDLRRVLIDLDGVRDAWVLAKSCACDVSYWAFCDLAGRLVLQYNEPVDPPHPAKEVWALGLYEVLLELENDPELGDLNDRMIVRSTVYHDANGAAHPVVMELRFPDIELLARDQWQEFLSNDAVFNDQAGFTIDLTRLGATKTYNVFSLGTEAEQNAYIQSQWNNVFYLSFKVTLTASATSIDIENAALRVFGDGTVRSAVSANAWRTLFTDSKAGGFIMRYRKKAKAARAAVAGAKAALQRFRNLDEDFCLVSGAGVEDVAVCADVEVKPGADIERVQAEIWFQIEQYMSPPIRFQTLRELQDQGAAVEDIFDGPALENGFIDDGDLEAAAFKTMLRSSDIINRLMSIDGVISINQLRMSKYDSEGNVVAGAADPAWVNGRPVYDPNKRSAAWLLAVSPRHQARLYLNQSRFLFYKNALPFLPRMDEARDTLTQLLGDAERPKNPNAPNDLPVPPGVYRNPDDYYPVQYSFPLAYGTGPAGLPSNATALRRAQARDLKAYLMVFEQFLGNALAQLAHTADLFSLDSGVANTYFVKAFDGVMISGFDDIAHADMFAQGAVQGLVESRDEFLERRNMFLDHLLARFGEIFNEYTLLLTSAAGEAVAQSQLIDNKISFLKHYPAISHDRAKAFNYAVTPCAPGNDPGIKRRVNLLLGFPDLALSWDVAAPDGANYAVSYSLEDGNGNPWLEGALTVTAASSANAEERAYQALVERMILADAYVISPSGDAYRLSLLDASGTAIGLSPEAFIAERDAAARRDALLAWSAGGRMVVVEHLLLRPKFIGDALYPACCDGGCATCGCEDPYSFRLTYVMPGWTERYTENLELRRYAERTIRRETPSHLLAKICWVGNDGFVENPCDEIVDKLADLLLAGSVTSSGTPPSQDEACACAGDIYHGFSSTFTAWFGDKKFSVLHQDVWQTQIDLLFQGVSAPADGTCTTVFTDQLWGQIRSLVTAHFVDIALHGWQFERFEWAWCQWLDANAAIDWTQERLMERVEGILAANVQTTAATSAQLCDCARNIVTAYGTQFYEWMYANIDAGNSVESLTVFTAPEITLCANMSFTAGTKEAVTELLKKRYTDYIAPSYWLWVVVSLLAGLRNTYPGATLHECDDGSDQNPVRLDNTALGNYPRRTTL